MVDYRAVPGETLRLLSSLRVTRGRSRFPQGNPGWVGWPIRPACSPNGIERQSHSRVGMVTFVLNRWVSGLIDQLMTGEITVEA